MKSLESYAIECYHKITEIYGKSKFYSGFPFLEVISDDNELLAGEFRDDCCEIMVNLDQATTKEEVARTITHEYIHYLQSPSWMTRYKKMYDYWDNPYEIEAYKREDELLNQLL